MSTRAKTEVVDLDAGTRMDRMYRHQRHIYDASRKFYLLGRDRLIAELQPKPGARICEIGCGTGRNLVAMAYRYPGADIYGIDASDEMLKTAHAKIKRHMMEDRIRIRCCLAEDLDPAATFGLARKFDVIIFSYALSMIPDWEVAIERAVASLEPNGVLAVVDFSGQRELPAWFRAILRRWLALFDVSPRVDLPGFLDALARRDRAALTVRPIFRDYACILKYERALSAH